MAIEQPASIAAPVGVPGTRDDGSATSATSSGSVRNRALSAVKTATLEHRFLALLLVVFLVKGVIVTFVHAPYSGHDEVAHYAYLQLVAEEYRIPVLPELDAWQDVYAADGAYTHDRMPAEFWQYCRRTTIDWSPGCGEYSNVVYAMSLGGQFYPTGWVYTANHPPLYYLVMTPLFWLSDGLTIEGQLYVLRLAAIPFGLMTVLFAFLTTRALFPRDRFLGITVPAFVAFQPQIAYEAAMLNNDIFAIAFTSAVIYLLTKGLKTGFPIRTVALVGLCYGLAVLSKNTSLTTGGIIAFAMIVGLGFRNWRAWLPKGAIAATVTGLMIWPWYLFMYRTYGDVTGLTRIRELQYWNYQSGDFPNIWDQLSNRAFLWMRWRETWGEFGWRLIPLNPELLRVLLWIVIAGMIGVAVWSIRYYRMNLQRSRESSGDRSAAFAAGMDPIYRLERWQVVGLLTMGVTCVLAYLAILQFGTTFALTQARYYFTAIVPAAILLMLGLRTLIPRRWLGYGQVGIFAALVVLTVVIYSGYVIPYWSTAGQPYPDIDPFYR